MGNIASCLALITEEACIGFLDRILSSLLQAAVAAPEDFTFHSDLTKFLSKFAQVTRKSPSSHSLVIGYTHLPFKRGISMNSASHSRTYVFTLKVLFMLIKTSN